MKFAIRFWILLSAFLLFRCLSACAQQDDLSIQLTVIDSLITTQVYDEALSRSQALESTAKSETDSDIAKESSYRQARVYNFTNNYSASDSILDLLLTQELDHPLDFSVKLLAYNNAMRVSNTERALEVLEDLGKSVSEFSPTELLSYRNAKADFYTIKEEYSLALENLLQAKKDLPENVSTLSEFNLNYQLGAIYLAIGVYDQALAIGIENQELVTSDDNFYLELFSIFTQIDAQEKLGNHEEVEKLFRRAEYLKQHQNVVTSYGFIYYTKAKCHFAMNELDSALHYFNQGVRISRELKSKKEKYENLLGKGLTHLKLNEIDMARLCLESAEKIKQYEHEDLCKLKIGLNLLDKDYKSAYENSVELTSKLKSDGNNKYSYDIISTLLTDKFDQEKRENQLLSDQKEKSRNNMFIFSLLGLTTAFLSFVLFATNRNKKNLEKLNNDLQSKNEALLSYNYISSHDLKEPARNIASFTDLLIKKHKQVDSEKEYNEILEIINNSSKTLLEIVKSLGIFSETSLNEEVQLEEVILRDVMDDVHKNLQQLIDKKNAKVNFDETSKIRSVKYSKPMLYLLLKNLVQNAIKYNPSSAPEVNVNVELRPNTYVFSVKDNGEGIREDKLEYIFKPFRTLQNKSLNQSSGLGLSICKNIVQKFGGEIWVDTKINEGSTFSFTVPRK